MDYMFVELESRGKERRELIPRTPLAALATLGLYSSRIFEPSSFSGFLWAFGA
jgi:hypothetical protein